MGFPLCPSSVAAGRWGYSVVTRLRVPSNPLPTLKQPSREPDSTHSNPPTSESALRAADHAEKAFVRADLAIIGFLALVVLGSVVRLVWAQRDTTVSLWTTGWAV